MVSASARLIRSADWNARESLTHLDGLRQGQPQLTLLADRVPCAVLVADAHMDLHHGLSEALGAFGHRVSCVADGESAARLLESDRHDVLLLGTALEGSPNGFDLCRGLRARGHQTPIIMLGDQRSEADIVTGLEAGADDYLIKPFGVAELRSRIRAILRRRRGKPQWERTLRFGQLVLDLDAREVTRHGQPVALTFSEYELLALLMSAPGRVFRRAELHTTILGPSRGRGARSIDVHVRNLRSKLERAPNRPQLIHTVRGIGYKVSAASVSGEPPLTLATPRPDAA